MEATISLSKGVFPFKKKKSNSNYTSPKGSPNAYYWCLEEGRDDLDIRKFTFENYQKGWTDVEAVVENLLDSIHSKVFEDLVQYVKRVGYIHPNSSETNDSSYLSKDIPAACLVTGVNMPDHDSIFGSLTKSLRAGVTPFVARLSSSHCTNIKTAIYQISSSFINVDDIQFVDSDDEEAMSKSPKKKRLKKSQCNLSVLAAWYKETINSQFDGLPKSPRKKLKKSPGLKSPCKLQRKLSKSPLIVIIEDVEGISPVVLQDIILICSEYRKCLPFVFVLGVATTPAAIHRYLSQDSSSHIAMETFQAQPSSVLLSQIIEKILMSSLPFHVGGKVFKLLLDIFLFHDLSVRNFIFGLKFCMLEHFLRGRVSFLCCDRKTRKLIMKDIPPYCLNSLKETPSFIRYYDSLSDADKKLMMNEEHLKKCILDRLDDLEEWYATFCILIKCLHKLVNHLPGTPLGKQVRELFSVCLSQHVTDTPEFQESWKLLSLCAKEELMPKFKSVQEVLADYPLNDAAKELKLKLERFCDALQNIDQSIQMDQSIITPTKPVTIELKPSDRFHLREKLLGGTKTKVRNRYEELRSEILSTFEHIFISNLKPFHNKPLHEVLFFDEIGAVKYQLLGSLRATIITGLNNPQKYLQCECCRLEDKDNILKNMPDLSLVYKLHLECGRLINLYDWLQAFCIVLGVDEEEDSVETMIKKKQKGKPPKKKKKVDEHLQARFIQAVSELQLLGFIKPTKKKTDHVQRLTWGGC